MPVALQPYYTFMRVYPVDGEAARNEVNTYRHSCAAEPLAVQAIRLGRLLIVPVFELPILIRCLRCGIWSANHRSVPQSLRFYSAKKASIEGASAVLIMIYK